MAERHRIFVSYCHVQPDQDLAVALVTALRASGHIVFIDRDIPAGSKWEEWIDEQLRDSNSMVVLLSAAAIQSDMVREEVERMARYHSGERLRLFVPIRVATQESLPYAMAARLNAYQHLFWREEIDTPDVVQRVLSALQPVLVGHGLLTTQVTAPSPTPQASPLESVLSPALLATNSAATSLRKGLDALTHLIAQPSVATSIGIAQASFQNAFEQVNLLIDYKDLHDQLHQLQMHCFIFLVRKQDAFTEDENFQSDLIEYVMTYEQVLRELRTIDERPTLQHAEKAWIDRLTQGLVLLRQAQESYNKESYIKCVALMRSVLSRQLFAINRTLVTASRNLRVEQLLNVLKTIAQNIDYTHLTPEQQDFVDLFAQSSTALNVLQTEIGKQIALHDSLQEVVTNLWEIDSNPVRGLVEEMRWQDMLPTLQLVYGGIVNPSDEVSAHRDWIQGLQLLDKQLQTAIESRDEKAITMKFRSYRSQADRVFFQTDKRLKQMCSALADDIRPQLNRLLQFVG